VSEFTAPQADLLVRPDDLNAEAPSAPSQNIDEIRSEPGDLGVLAVNLSR
jgi:hypothetical protein